MGKSWKYTKKAEKQLCGSCGVELSKDELLLCRQCWREHDFHPKDTDEEEEED